MTPSDEKLLREYIKSIAFPASTLKHKWFVYRAQNTFPYRSPPRDYDAEEELQEDDMIYVLRPKSSKNMAGSKRGWASPPVPVGIATDGKKKYFSLKSLINMNKNFNI